ncbi:hypothetical protein AKJ16_DCAP10267 [Drosera capensis]
MYLFFRSTLARDDARKNDPNAQITTQSGETRERERGAGIQFTLSRRYCDPPLLLLFSSERETSSSSLSSGSGS